MKREKSLTREKSCVVCWQVLSDGQEVGSYLFRRTLPSQHLVPDDVRWMVRDDSDFMASRKRRLESRPSSFVAPVDCPSY